MTSAASSLSLSPPPQDVSLHQTHKEQPMLFIMVCDFFDSQAMALALVSMEPFSFSVIYCENKDWLMVVLLQH